MPNFNLMGLRLRELVNFTNIIPDNERISCAILIKFAGYMGVLRLYNSVKIGCLGLTDKKAINNLPR